MKTIFSKILAGVILASLLTFSAKAEGRIATINLQKVFDNYWKRQQAQGALKDKQDALAKEEKGFVEDYNKAKDDYTKLSASANDQSVTAEEREKRKTAAESKLLEIKTTENSIRTFEDNAREQMDSQVKRIRDSIIEDIRAAINARAKTAGYSLVIDTASESSNLTPIILYTNGENDLTDAILSQLNAGAPATFTDSSKPDTKSSAPTSK